MCKRLITLHYMLGSCNTDKRNKMQKLLCSFFIFYHFSVSRWLAPQLLGGFTVLHVLNRTPLPLALLLSLPSLQPGLVATSNKHPCASKQVNAGTEVRWGLLFNRFTSYNPLVQSGITVDVQEKKLPQTSKCKSLVSCKIQTVSCSKCQLNVAGVCPARTSQDNI